MENKLCDCSWIFKTSICLVNKDKEQFEKLKNVFEPVFAAKEKFENKIAPFIATAVSRQIRMGLIQPNLA
jgi:hypothetical protein